MSITMVEALASLGIGGAQAISLGLSGQAKLSRASMMGIDPETGAEVLPEYSFQFLPETISDAIEVGWDSKQVPGVSHGIMQWSSNGGRTINFELVLFRMMLPSDQQPSLLGGMKADPDSEENRRYNLNIEYMISWLRSFCYPIYTEGSGNLRRAKSPPICILNLPNLCLNEDGSDTIFTVMTGCDVTYEDCFPNGSPQVAKVALSFKQIIQDPRSGRPSFNFKTVETLKEAQVLKFSDEGRYGLMPRKVGIIDPKP